MNNELDFLIYREPDGDVKIRATIDGETIWLTQKAMSELFGVGVPAISKHLDNIYDDGELQSEATVSKMEIVQDEGGRKVKRMVDFYNLDAIISVGYRVNSAKATHFRIWATAVLKEYMQKGFVLDDDRLAQARTAFGKDYFRELLDGKGKISAERAKAKAEAEYDTFNKTQKIVSDFEKISERTKGAE